MKKILLFASALAGMFFAASCQQENLEPVQAGQQVTFTIEAPAAMQTKAIADGQNVNQLVYEVWLTPTLGNLETDAQKLYQATAPMTSDGTINKAELTLDLVNDQKFTVLFWAQVADTYDTDELTAVGYNDLTALEANDESLAAFYGVAYVDDCRNVKKDGTSASPEVILKRPFAQVNLCTLNERAPEKNPADYTIAIVNSKMTLKNVPTEFNVATGDVDGDAELEFTYAPVPSDPATIKVSEKEYYYAGMNYVFAGDNLELTYDIQTSLNNSTNYAVVNNVIASVPVKKNYRTNIVGNLLTSKTDYVIIVDAEFEAPEYVLGEEWSQAGAYNYTVNEGASATVLAEVLAHADAEAKAAATKAAGPEVIINLNGNVVWETGAGIGSTPLLPEDSPISAVVINGNGKTFTATGAGVGKIRLANGGKLTFNNVKIVDQSVSYAENSWEYGYLEFGGVLRLENCEVVNAIMVSGETAAFKNCTFNSNKDNEYDVWVDNGSAYFTECSFAGARGLKMHEAYGSEVVKVAVEGCTFGPLSKKPGVAMGDLNAETTVTIKNSLFNRCQPGDQNLYIYETDTDVTAFTFVAENNVIIPSGDANVELEDGTIIVATATGLKNAIKSAKDGAKIQLVDGVYEGVFFVEDKNLTIEAYVAGQATINGKLAVAASGKTVNVKNIVFENSFAGSVATGHQFVDKTGKYCIGLYCASVNVEGCTFNLSDNGGINFYAINDPEYCTVKNSTFNCNGFRPILSKVNVTVDGCTFNDQYKYALQVWGNQNNGEDVVFTNNTINEAGKTSGCADAFKSYVSVSKSYELSNVAFTITGNTAGYNFVYDNHANVDITSCTLNGAAIVAEQCYSVASDIKEVAMDYKEGYTYVGNSAEFTAALAADSKKIALAPGTYEGTFHVLKEKEITSVDAGNKAMIKGRVHVNSVNATFTNVSFDRNETNSNEPNNTASNALQYKAVVMIYGDQTHTIKFDGCNFYNNNGTHKSAITNVACDLIVDKCYFEGYSSSIYSQANLSVTNSTFNYTGENNVILSINGCGDTGGKVIFKNNEITNKIFALSQFLSTVGFGNGTYHFDVQDNTGAGFDYYFLNEGRVANKTFADGSETF